MTPKEIAKQTALCLLAIAETADSYSVSKPFVCNRMLDPTVIAAVVTAYLAAHQSGGAK